MACSKINLIFLPSGRHSLFFHDRRMREEKFRKDCAMEDGQDLAPKKTFKTKFKPSVRQWTQTENYKRTSNCNLRVWGGGYCKKEQQSNKQNNNNRPHAVCPYNPQNNLIKSWLPLSETLLTHYPLSSSPVIWSYHKLKNSASCYSGMYICHVYMYIHKYVLIRVRLCIRCLFFTHGPVRVRQLLRHVCEKGCLND